MRPGAFYWALHRISGVFLVLGMAVHFYIMHLGAADALKHETVLLRLSQPGWIGFNLALLTLVVYHGLYGVMGIVRDYVSTERAVRYARLTLTAAGLMLMAYGIFILSP